MLGALLVKALSDALARVFGEGDSTAQAEVINALGAAVWNGCRRNAQDFETQLCYLEDELDEHGKRFAQKLGEFVEGGQ